VEKPPKPDTGPAARYRLTQHVEPEGQVWQICGICIEWIRFEDLAVDPTDGKRWDTCKPCHDKENRHAA